MDDPEKAAKRLSHEDYTVGWICPLEVEQIAAQEMLDEEHERLPQPANDHNVYTLGSINGHNVVIAGLPSAGNNPAATVVTQMRNTFAELRFGLLVGIGGGVPAFTDNGHIRLGHVVVSKPTGEHSGAVQYDHGKAEAGQFRRTGFLAAPPTILLNAAQDLAVRRARSRTDPLHAHLSRIDTTIRGLRRYKYPGADKDHLYRADYVHPEPKVSCQKCGCDPSQRVDRSSDGDSDEEDEENGEEIVVHRGTIAAGELVVKDGLLRDKLANQYGILCFEMEAAGVLADFPCLVIRGISDYSDSNKNDKWHGYAAATAAAYARQLFFHMPVDEVRKCRIAESGSGKTILSSSIIDELAKKAQDPADVVLYFYFEYKSNGNVTFDGMIRNFAAHLFPKKKEAQEALQSLYDDNQNGLPPTKGLIKTFESMVSHFNRVQIVIDALDEIKHRKDLDTLLEWIKATADAPNGRIRLIVTSRKEEDIESLLSNVGETVVLSRDVVKDDIKKFRLVFCQLEELRTCFNYEDLLETLQSLPQTLEDTYTRILDGLTSKKQRQRAITILQLLLFHRSGI
ncbi:putative multiple ankyrin repeats single kh domain protein [Lasiodiplodia theobromae]|uniref:putative multiple ankyrin repeats single kh domain protein n=1 Tax=Lasiodiplodia theobromae TaxID=45133 RepID=UPI0015C3D3ED|nr:putative multiple ankyrin repeats single kh domain protein [Lasiodiplodia theobromae]KAF4543371.1 putative multiple ankyrin repeats single kh domain protein [Lasiodiplodia theobromae]